MSACSCLYQFSQCSPLIFPGPTTSLSEPRDSAVFGCVPCLIASFFLLLYAGSLQYLSERCQLPFPLPCLYWTTFTILLAQPCCRWAQAQVNESSFCSFFLQRGRSFASWLLRVNIDSLSCNQTLVLFGIQEKNTWWGRRRSCVCGSQEQYLQDQGSLWRVET